MENIDSVPSNVRSDQNDCKRKESCNETCVQIKTKFLLTGCSIEPIWMGYTPALDLWVFIGAILGTRIRVIVNRKTISKSDQ